MQSTRWTTNELGVAILKTNRCTILIQDHNSDCDGFTVLPDGNFLINDGDADTHYREYWATTGSGHQTGQVRSPSNGGLQIDLSSYLTPSPQGALSSTGVALAADGTLYFIGGHFESTEPFGTRFVQLNASTGAFIRSQDIVDDQIEDIDVIIP